MDIPAGQFLRCRHHRAPCCPAVGPCYPTLGRLLPLCTPASTKAVMALADCRQWAGDAAGIGTEINDEVSLRGAGALTGLLFDRLSACRAPLAGITVTRQPSGALTGGDLLARFDAFLSDRQCLVEAGSRQVSVGARTPAVGWTVYGRGRHNPAVTSGCCALRSDRFHQLVYPRTRYENTLSSCEST
jgi:hypothetical protein